MKAIIVDDEAVAAAAMKRRIRWERYGITQVRMAASMRQAVQAMEEEAIDLMLCDVEMPGGSGLDLYEWVRTYSPDTECIFVSCHPEYEYVRKALTMGSMDYVLKPVDYEEMDRILTEAARRIRDRRNQGAPLRDRRDVSNEEEMPAAEEETAQNEAVTPRSEAVQDSIAYIREHLDTNMSIREISEVAHLHPQYFMRVFKKETGRPVLEFITECRLEKARELLAGTALPITEVALSSGYDNFSYFSKLFKRNLGMTPSEYRRQYRDRLH